MNRLSLLPLILAGLSPTATGEEYTVYFQQGTKAASLVSQLAPLRAAVPQAECRYVVLDTTADTMAKAINSANALKAGVDELPSLVIGDAQGAYAAIPLPRLSAESLQAAQAAATAPDREQKARKRNYEAQQYLLFARMALIQPLEGDTLQQCLSSCRALMNHPFATPEDKQRLGFKCLYPLLLREYTNMYQGAHTPASEAKFLEAISALEAARDLDRNSAIGKQAFAERERLRKARRQARTME